MKKLLLLILPFLLAGCTQVGKPTETIYKEVETVFVPEVKTDALLDYVKGTLAHSYKCSTITEMDVEDNDHKESDHYVYVFKVDYMISLTDATIKTMIHRVKLKQPKETYKTITDEDLCIHTR